MTSLLPKDNNDMMFLTAVLSEKGLTFGTYCFNSIKKIGFSVFKLICGIKMIKTWLHVIC